MSEFAFLLKKKLIAKNIVIHTILSIFRSRSWRMGLCLIE